MPRKMYILVPKYDHLHVLLFGFLITHVHTPAKREMPMIESGVPLE